MIKSNKYSARLKPIAIAVGMTLFSLPALADAHDARIFGVAAQDLLQKARTAEQSAQTYPSLDAPEISSDFVSNVQRLGISAARLSREMTEIDGPEDFQCIFRGMAKETGDQLSAMELAQTGADQADALKRLITMLDDAVMVSEAAALTFEGKAPPITEKTTIGSCSIE